MSTFVFAKERDRLNSIVQFNEKSFERMHIRHSSYGFTCHCTGEEIYLNIFFEYDSKYDFYSIGSFEMQVYAYDKSGHYISGSTEECRMSDSCHCYLDTECYSDYDRVEVTLLGKTPRLLGDPNVLPNGLPKSRILFNIDTDSLVENDISILSIGVDTTECRAGKYDEANIYVEFGSLKNKPMMFTQSVTILLFNSQDSIIGMGTFMISKEPITTSKCLFHEIMKISKDETVRRIKLNID